MKQIIITSNGTGVLEATDPNKKVYQSTIDGTKRKIITVSNPTPGKWLIFANSTKLFSIEVSGTSKVTSFDYGFSVIPVTTKDETQPKPIKSKYINNMSRIPL